MLKTIAVLFVSNEILPDEKRDRIAKFFSDELTSLNCSLTNLSVLKENESILTHELKVLAKTNDFVIIIGECEDNSIFKAVGNVYNDDSIRKAHFSNNFGNNNEQCNRSSPLIRHLMLGENKSKVIFYIERIYIIRRDNFEDLFKKLLKSHIGEYMKEPVFRKLLQVNLNGSRSSDIGTTTVVNGHGNENTRTVVLEKTDFESAVKEEIHIRKQSHTVFEICDKDFVVESIYNSNEEHIRAALKNVEKCLESFGFDNTFLTFNGGKDCTVLLHLLNVIKKIRYPDHKKPLPCLYVKDKDSFPEQDKFVAQCEVYYNLDVVSLSMGMKEALGEFLKRKPNMKACFLGTRRTDPYSQNLNIFQMTDSSWPSVMRVSPLLDWHYSDIWNYLLFYKVPYCKLYDQGYTSLGSASSTVRNPSLSFLDIKHGEEIFLPAYRLLNEAEERRGRVETKK